MADLNSARSRCQAYADAERERSRRPTRFQQMLDVYLWVPVLLGYDPDDRLWKPKRRLAADPKRGLIEHQDGTDVWD